MEPEARVEFFRQIAAHFRSLVPFEEKIDEMITDEQFVRNAVASIYRQKTSNTFLRFRSKREESVNSVLNQ